MPKSILFLLFILPLIAISQNVTGKIYDAETTVKGAKIYNKNINETTNSNESGDFSIKASVNDSLVFSSLFHEEKLVVVTQNHFNHIVVFELKKIVNNLDEVLLSERIKEKAFQSGQYSADLGLQIANDIKNNPHLYSPQSGNLDFIEIAGLIKNLLFKGKKNKAPKSKPINYKSLDSLFSNSDFFTENLLVNDLKVPKQYRFLFFYYCDNKQIDNTLLLETNSVILLDTLIKCSSEFAKIISEYEK
ncbi:carboxypeptidase-like regulatory domain-containing protein [Tamlana crocina]